MSRRILIAGGLLAIGMGASLTAAPITGTFNIGGTITMTATSLSWTFNDPPFTAQKATIGPADTGSFAALAGTTITIRNLNSGLEPVGSSFAAQPFISFDA